MHKTILIAIISFLLGAACCFEFLKQSETAQKSKVPKPDIPYTLKEEKADKFEYIADTRSNGSKPATKADFQEMGRTFYTSLADCEPLNIISENGYEEYIIEGLVGDKCHFKHRQIGFIDTICNLPEDIYKKYAKEGLSEIHQLDELRAQNKTGFVESSHFITEINNNKSYCRYRQYNHPKK